MSLIRGLSNMASSKLKIQLFYDVVSPFSWVAFEVSRPPIIGCVIKMGGGTQ